MEEISLVIPYPIGISVNHCWKISRTGVFLNPKVKRFRMNVNNAFISQYPKFSPTNKYPLFQGNVRVDIMVYPPDVRKRDIDNLAKVVLDAIQKSNIYADDYQVAQLFIERRERVKMGKLEIKVNSL